MCAVVETIVLTCNVTYSTRLKLINTILLLNPKHKLLWERLKKIRRSASAKTKDMVKNDSSKTRIKHRGGKGYKRKWLPQSALH